LGDGYIRIFPGRKNALMEFNHSFKQKDYVDWKYSILKNISGSIPKIRKGNGNRMAYRFYSKQIPEISELYKLFYKDGKKIIPDTISLDPIILTVWFMDDGSKCRSVDVYLNTQQFCIADQKKLIVALEKIGLKANLNKDKIITSMKYKIEL
ncbi:MAG: hypothetical protein AAB674_02740, partial [Patescibacteria group bacterium]